MYRLVLMLALCGFIAPLCAEESNAVTNPLAALPSKPAGEHLAKIKALGDNEWVNLGQAAPCARFPNKTVARGRAWGSKMAFAPDLGGAFFCGTGVHGAVHDGYYMDDLWFYDAHTHKWTCLYPGATKQTQCTLDDNGFEVDAEGNHVPISYLSHTYNNITYDTDRKKFFVFWTQCPWWGRAVPQRWAWLDQNYAGVKKKSYGSAGPIIMDGKHPLFWDVTTHKWERRFVKDDGPRKRNEGILEYIPSRKQTFRLHHGLVWFYDYEKNQWLKSPAEKTGVGYDANGCYDPKGEKIYVGAGTYFYVFDLKTETWKNLGAEGQPAFLANTNSAQMHYDTVNDTVIWHRSHGPVFAYDTKKNTWHDMNNTCFVPGLPSQFHGFYHPELNAHLFYVASDSSHNKATWLAYRYRRADSKTAAPASTDDKGEVVDGIQLAISTRRTQIKAGETWQFDSRVFNTGEKVVALDFYDGMSYLEVDGPDGPLLPADREAGVRKVQKRQKRSTSFLIAVPGGRPTWIGGGRMGLSSAESKPDAKPARPAFKPGTYKVRWVYRNEGPDDTQTKQYQVKWSRKPVPEWIGTVRSNEVTLTVVE